MNFDVSARTIFFARHGSHAYGLNIESSDEDYKGICIKPKEFYFGVLNSFEQHEHMGSKSDGIDSVTYSLDKFCKLAMDCNPSIIEVLHVSESDVLKIDAFGEELRHHRNDFISKKAKFTFSGYAHAQLQRIKSHRSWLLNPPKDKPERSSFHLSETSKVSASELGAFNASIQSGLEIELPKDVLTLYTREKAYQSAFQHYTQYVNWIKTRNSARAELEAKFGYDTKHGMHLIRLMRMCKEILASGKVNVKRDDREDLLLIRSGSRSYDNLIEEADNLNEECDKLYVTSTLQKEPNRKMLDTMIVSLTSRYISLYGLRMRTTLRGLRRVIFETLNEVTFKPRRERPSVYSNLGVKNKVVNIKTDSPAMKAIDQDLVDMTIDAYEKIGGHPKINAMGDLANEYTDIVTADIDDDPEPDLYVSGKMKHGKMKVGASATDGTAIAKNFMYNLKKQLHTNGWWAEVSDAPAHIALNKLGIRPVEDEAKVRALVGDDIVWHGEHPEGKFKGTHGWYTRKIGGIPHTKIIVGDI